MTEHRLSGAARLRYARHLALPQVGEAGQHTIGRGRVLVIGLGGLGSPASLYLASAGIGELWLNDFDRVDGSNLQRQVLYRASDVGERKATAAAKALREVNGDVKLHPLDERLDQAGLRDAVGAVDVVLDGSDNFATRFAVNAACAQVGTPVVSGAAIRFEGQLAVFRHDRRRQHGEDTPCYRCLFAESDEANEDCQGNGVFAPLVGTVGTMMAAEALKLLLGVGEDSAGRLLTYDALNMHWRSLRFARDPACPVCA
ncbi:MAG: molybdopterin-synthase adenylyltransferase MoeB [Pseudomonadota bacterium]